MTRRNALCRLHLNLLIRRDRLSKKLTGELAYLHDSNAAAATGDSADLAFEASGDEMSSRLAELDDRELSQIERALAHWNQGTYGICESCQKPIGLMRLNALPYTPFCISCERAMEKSPEAEPQSGTGNWSKVSDAQASTQDQRIKLSQLERDLAGSGRG